VNTSNASFPLPSAVNNSRKISNYAAGTTMRNRFAADNRVSN
jgi:hypothetical protein